MKKKILGFTLAIIMLMNFSVLMPISRAATFPDVSDSHWANFYISAMKYYNIINGYEDGTFKPDNEVKTGEFIKMICMTIWPEFKYNLAEDAEHWSKPYVFALHNIILYRWDYGPTRVERVITRAEAAVLLCSFVKVMNTDEYYTKLDTTGSYIKNMKDESLVTDEETRIAIDNCIRFGLINGFEDGTFRPNDSLTRAQASKLIYTAIQTYSGGEQ